MRVIFLDFDGVLNSQASFIMEKRTRDRYSKRAGKLGPIKHTLCHVCTSNFQLILDKCPDVKIVISSTWRVVHEMSWLKKTLKKYGIDSSRVIDKTPQVSFRPRGFEISEWLEEHPEVSDYVIIDDNSDMTVHMEKFVKTTWNVGLTLDHVADICQRLGVDLYAK